MKKYIQPEINVMEMELDSQLCAASETIGIGSTPAEGPSLAPTRPRFSIWDSEDDVEEESEIDRLSSMNKGVVKATPPKHPEPKFLLGSGVFD